MKECLSPKEICRGKSKPFARILKYIKKIGFDEEPSYNKVKFMFTKILLR